MPFYPVSEFLGSLTLDRLLPALLADSLPINTCLTEQAGGD